MNRNSNSSGFTLIEILIAMLITAIIMITVSTTLISTMGARKKVSALTESTEAGARILNLLEKDKGKWSWNTADEVIDFENAATSAAFQKEIQAFQEVGELQIQLQTKLIQGL